MIVKLQSLLTQFSQLLQHPLIAALFGGIIGYLFEKIVGGRKLKSKDIYSYDDKATIEDEFHWITVSSIYNPNQEIACLYGFKAVTENGDEAELLFDKKIDKKIKDREIILMCANNNQPLETVTYIKPKHVYPLKICIPLDCEVRKKRAIIKKITFRSKTCGFFKSKLQYFRPDTCQEYEIKLSEKMIDNQKPLEAPQA